MTNFRADLHCHTSCSDGSMSPQELLRFAKEINLRAISITDHDSIQAYTLSLFQLAEELELLLLPGVEFSAMVEDSSVHILGYGFRLDSPAIKAFCQRHAQRRSKRNQAILDNLRQRGMPIMESELLSSSEPSVRTIGRPHIALEMVKNGYVLTVQEAFRKYIGEGAPCFAKGDFFSVEETIDLIHQADGLAVIAHPHLIQNSRILQHLLTKNFDGIECFYGRYPSAEHQKWRRIAKAKNWLVTGGSDFHGTIKPNIPLGCSWVPEAHFQPLYQHYRPTDA